MVLAQILTQLGLTPEEADIYLSLLSHGSQSASSLARTTKVQRTYVYRVCQSLMTKGLATQNKKPHGTTFSPLSPDHLLAVAEDQKTKASQAQTALDGILPSLKDKFGAIEERPVITYFEGIEGIKKVYLDTIKEEKPILALVETSKVDPAIYDWVTKDYITLRTAKKIAVKAIVSTGPKTQTYVRKNESELRETKTVTSDKFPFEHEVNIYGNKVALINHRLGSKLIGIIIDNPVIAKTFRSWFELTWSLV